EFTLGLAFGEVFHNAVTALFQSLGLPFADQRARFIQQWDQVCADMRPLERVAGDGGTLYRRSQSLLLAHEDKLYPGAIIASLSIPWGEARSAVGPGAAPGLGGYHLVWTR